MFSFVFMFVNRREVVQDFVQRLGIGMMDMCALSYLCL